MKNNSNKAWYCTPLIITIVITIFCILAALFVPLLNPFLQQFIMFWKKIGLAVIVGLILGGVIDVLVPNKYIIHYLSKPGKRTIFNAAILGVFMSVCSHGILAISMELYKKGASCSSVITFLLASPWANAAMTIMLFAFFGTKAILFISGALLIAIITGFCYQYLEKKNLIEKNNNSVNIDTKLNIPKDIKDRWDNYNFTINNNLKVTKQISKSSWQLANMVLWWIIIGTLIGSALAAFVPNDIFQSYLGPSVTGLLITLAVATIIEVCSEGSSPIAFAIYQQTNALGNAFIFLTAGVITDFTEIALIWSNIGKRAAICLPVITVPQALLLAYLFNFL